MSRVDQENSDFILAPHAKKIALCASLDTKISAITASKICSLMIIVIRVIWLYIFRYKRDFLSVYEPSLQDCYHLHPH